MKNPIKMWSYKFYKSLNLRQVKLYATFTQDEQAIGNADVYFTDGQTPQYNIHGNNVMSMIAIANAVETVYQELQDELEGE